MFTVKKGGLERGGVCVAWYCRTLCLFIPLEIMPSAPNCFLLAIVAAPFQLDSTSTRVASVTWLKVESNEKGWMDQAEHVKGM